MVSGKTEEAVLTTLLFGFMVFFLGHARHAQPRPLLSGSGRLGGTGSEALRSQKTMVLGLFPFDNCHLSAVLLVTLGCEWA